MPDDFRHTHPFASLDLSTLRDALARIGKRHGSTPAQVAIAWVLQHEAMAGAIVGIRTAAEAKALPGAAGLRLEPAEVAELEAAAPSL